MESARMKVCLLVVFCLMVEVLIASPQEKKSPKSNNSTTKPMAQPQNPALLAQPAVITITNCQPDWAGKYKSNGYSDSNAKVTFRSADRDYTIHFRDSTVFGVQEVPIKPGHPAHLDVKVPDDPDHTTYVEQYWIVDCPCASQVQDNKKKKEHRLGSDPNEIIVP